MGTGTLDTTGPATLPPRHQAKRRRRPTIPERALRTLAVAETLGLAALFALGSLPYLVRSLLGRHPEEV
jgi:hypothetical protein